MLDNATICAIASSALPAPRGIVRLSGTRAWEIGRQLWDGPPFSGGAALRGKIALPVGRTPAWVYCFAGPRSYTGEDQLELHPPGNPLLLRLLLDALVALGARPAEPGEFTARAYFNARLDLSEAEGVAAIVSAQNQRELQAARQLLAGELARRLGPPMELLAQTLALVEVGIDFSEEDVSFLTAADLGERLGRIDRSLAELLRNSSRFDRLSHEPSIALVGRPNAGKSTLVNALCGSERAVVSASAGTTRDALSAQVALSRGMVRLIDAAGLDEPDGELGRQMQERARRALAQADVVVLAVDGNDPQPPPALSRSADLIVHTKVDLIDPGHELCVSAHTGQGMEALRHRLDELAFGRAGTEAGIALNRRHVRAIEQARNLLAGASIDQVAQVPELVATDLRAALDELGGILGQVTPDDVLGRIFAGFCIGK